MEKPPNSQLEEALKELFDVIVEALRIDKFAEWLNRKLK